MDALDYPRIDATVETDGIINLTIQDHNPRTFQDVTTEEALGQVWNHCAHLAQTLGRDVKIYVQEGAKTSYYTLTPEGEPTLQTVTEEVEKTSIWRRKAILIPAAALLALGLGGGALATVNALNQPTTAAATTPAGIALTLDNGTYTTGALSGDGQRLSYVDGTTLYVVDTKGTLVSQTDLTKIKIEAAGLTIHPTSDGFLYTAPGSYFMWAGGKFSNINTITTKAQTIITRAGEPSSSPATTPLLEASKKSASTAPNGTVPPLKVQPSSPPPKATASGHPPAATAPSSPPPPKAPKPRHDP